MSHSQNGWSKYPTKEQVLENLHIPTEEEVNAVNRWKSTYYKGWANLSTVQKHQRLATLIAELNIANRGKNITYLVDDLAWRYDPEDNTIYGVQNNPSIVSALHELGHHLYGISELYACGYSVGIFKTCFQQAYEELQWKGHMLVRPYASA